MERNSEYDRKLAELAAAQLVEQLSHMKTTKLELPIKDSSGEWLVTAQLVNKS